MKRIQTVLIWASFVSSTVLLLTAGLLVALINLAPKLSDVNTLFNGAWLFLYFGYPAGILFAVPALIIAIALRSRILKTSIAFAMGSMVAGAWWIMGNIPIGY